MERRLEIVPESPGVPSRMNVARSWRLTWAGRYELGQKIGELLKENSRRTHAQGAQVHVQGQLLFVRASINLDDEFAGAGSRRE